jgi:hypothetical protein
LHATIRKRFTQDNFVIDRKSVVTKKGEPPTELIAIHLVRGDLIQRVWFLFGGEQWEKSTPGNVQAMKDLISAVNNHDIDGALALYDTDARVRALPDNDVLIQDRSEQGDRLSKSFDYDPAVRVDIEDTMAVGDFVVLRERISGSRGDPYDDVVVYKLADEKIRKTWALLKD